ncbi:sensor histidine kinase [Tsuneonella deserti]|nr:PAS domain-containing protein [Tsuneonella deserti]
MSSRQISHGTAEVPDAAVDGSVDARAAGMASLQFDGLGDDDELARITRFAAKLCDTRLAMLTIIEDGEQRIIACSGCDRAEAPSLSRACSEAMREGPLVIPDLSADPRFEDGAGPDEPSARFYAGVPLVSKEHVPVGTLSVIDPSARPGGLGPVQLEGLEVLAAAVMLRVEAQRTSRASSLRASESARAMREIADMVPGIVWSADGDGNFDYFNSRWGQITGLAPPAMVSEWRPMVHPDDADRTFDTWTKSFSEGRAFECEYRLKQADGSWRWTLARALPLQDAAGKVVRWHGTLTDIHEGRRRSDDRDLLARELSHRIKNIFAVVSGLISLRARRSPENREFAQELIDTIGALGRAHDFVRPVEGVKGDSLHGLLIELMAPYADGHDRVTIVGDDCAIGPRAATPLALTFHELATNSAKYGAMSVDDGSISIALDCPEHADQAFVVWRENGGPAGADAGEEGFGSRLIRSSIEGQLGGRIERRFAEEGLEVRLSIPLVAIRR